MAETISGEGPWRVWFHQGQAVRVELLHEGTMLVFGDRKFRNPCARCGTPIDTHTPTNEEMDVCNTCGAILAAQYG